MRFILASASPRRARLLRRIVRNFAVQPARIDERLLKGEAFPAAAKRLAAKKAKAIATPEPQAIVIAADTIAYMGKKIFHKTSNEKKARSILRLLSGKTHCVITGVAAIIPGKKPVSYSVLARVKMKKITPAMLGWYLKTGEWKGRAGSYDVSGKGRKLVETVMGEEETVIGLPLKRLRKLFASRHP